jgi:hypothetical protein
MAVGWALYFLVGVLGYIAAPAVLSALATYPGFAAIKDTLWPHDKERRTFIVAFVTPPVLAAVIAVVVRARLDPLWMMSGMTLLPVVLLSSPLLSMNRAAAIRLLALAIVFPLAALAASPIIAFEFHVHGQPNNDGTHYSLIAQAVDREWREHVAAPLRIVGGERPLVDGSNPYFPGKPATFAISEPRRTPWADDDRIKRDGIAIVCWADDSDCLQRAKTYTARPNTVIERLALARYFFGTKDKPIQYQIAIIPPQ